MVQRNENYLRMDLTRDVHTSCKCSPLEVDSLATFPVGCRFCRESWDGHGVSLFSAALDLFGELSSFVAPLEMPQGGGPLRRRDCNSELEAFNGMEWSSHCGRTESPDRSYPKLWSRERGEADQEGKLSLEFVTSV